MPEEFRAVPEEPKKHTFPASAAAYAQLIEKRQAYIRDRPSKKIPLHACNAAETVVLPEELYFEEEYLCAMQFYRAGIKLHIVCNDMQFIEILTLNMYDTPYMYDTRHRAVYVNAFNPGIVMRDFFDAFTEHRRHGSDTLPRFVFPTSRNKAKRIRLLVRSLARAVFISVFGSLRFNLLLSIFPMSVLGLVWRLLSRLFHFPFDSYIASTTLATAGIAISVAYSVYSWIAVSDSPSFREQHQRECMRIELRGICKEDTDGL